MFTTITCLICLFVIIASLGIHIYYAIDSFRRKEYQYCVGFVTYKGLCRNIEVGYDAIKNVVYLRPTSSFLLTCRRTYYYAA